MQVIKFDSKKNDSHTRQVVIERYSEACYSLDEPLTSTVLCRTFLVCLSYRYTEGRVPAAYFVKLEA